MSFGNSKTLVILIKSLIPHHDPILIEKG